MWCRLTQRKASPIDVCPVRKFRRRVADRIHPVTRLHRMHQLREAQVRLRDPRAGSIIRSMIKTRVLAAAFGFLLLIGGVAIAQRPKENISPGRHPNLAAAQRFSQQAWERIVAAQEANEWDLQGHAQRAKNLLDQVNNELKQAAEASNRRER